MFCAEYAICIFHVLLEPSPLYWWRQRSIGSVDLAGSHHWVIALEHSLPFCRQEEIEDNKPDWNFNLTVREADTSSRPSILEAPQKSVETSHLKENSQNYVNEVSAAPVEEQVVGKKEEEEGEHAGGESNRLSNGLDPHLAAAAPVTPNVTTNHSPRSSVLQESRLSTLSNDSNSSRPLSNGLPTEQEMTSTGEESSMQPVGDDAVRHRHETVKSITEETRELDDYLSRSSVTSVFTENQVSNMEASINVEGFERVGGMVRRDVEDDEENERGAEVRFRLVPLASIETLWVAWANYWGPIIVPCA